MKNAFKFGFLGLAITLSVAACKGSGSASTTDTVKKDSTATTVVDSTKKDSTVKVDTVVKKDSTKKM